MEQSFSVFVPPLMICYSYVTAQYVASMIGLYNIISTCLLAEPELKYKKAYELALILEATEKSA